jgi:hypothetical protein
MTTPQDAPDQVDRLFSSMAFGAPPPGLSGRVLSAVEQHAARRRRLALRALVPTLIVTAIVSFWIGSELRSSGALELIELFILDAGVLLADPKDAALAVLERSPFAATGLLVVLMCAILRAASIAFHSTIDTPNPARGPS